MTRESQSAAPAMDTMLDILANRYRRRVLVALLDHNPQDDDETQIPDDAAPDDEDPEELLLQMRHVHLPKLEEAGFIEWDQETNSVTKGPQFEEIRPLLELMANHGDELPDDWL
ncbi:DUF7344 domain-containing protein [Haloprofundus marisrubri]|nr:hypothetical protein [Haloprofundus marisrubri]